MKTIPILLIILFAVNQGVTAKNFYEKGDTLNVWAVSGLNMREGPGTDFPKIKKLEYGEQVEIVDEDLRSTPLNLTIVKKHGKNAGFVLEGHWVQVKIGTEEGYVFDGYLSRLPVVKIEVYKTGGWNAEDFTKYVERKFSLLKKEMNVESKEAKNGKQHIFHYSNGIKLFKLADGSCRTVNMQIQNISKNEAYLLFNIFWEFEPYLEKLEYPFSNNVDENKNEQLVIWRSDSTCDFKLQFKNGQAIFYLSCCC